jgi:uncharacterized protein (DUF885 family)
MVERGVSQARMIFAMNSVNVEGWALYAEEIIQPLSPGGGAIYDPLEQAGQIGQGVSGSGAQSGNPYGGGGRGMYCRKR